MYRKWNSILSSIIFSRKSCHLWDNVEKYGRGRQATDGNITRRMRFACWITKAADTHSEYVTLTAFARQQWLRERPSILLLYVHCLRCYFAWRQGMGIRVLWDIMLFLWLIGSRVFFFRNIANRLPKDTAPYPRKHGPSEHQISKQGVFSNMWVVNS
jgi:hypothetical protein